MEADWDLHAVVRGCSAASSTSSSASTTSSLFNLPLFEKTISLDPIGPTLLSSSSSIEELHDLCKPFFSKSPKPLPPHIPPPPPPPTSSSPSLVSPLSPSSPFSYNSTSTPTTSTTKTLKNNNNLQPKNLKLSHPSPSSSTPRSKRRKNQLKKVCQVPAESLSSDIWAWRKYGQKPIKGSPYPRGYYRCSSSKGCLARKQVERNRSDPSMFIVTYTAEHNHPAPTHRNSLAGSTRQKPATAAGAGETEKTPAKLNSPANSEEEEIVPSSQVEMEDLMEEEEDEELGLSDSVLTDDFFDGLDELTGPPAPPSAASPVTGDIFGDPFSSAGFAMPAWPTTNAAATAGGNC